MTAAAAAALALGDVVTDHAGRPALVLGVNRHGHIALLLLAGTDPGRQSGIAASRTRPVTGPARAQAQAAARELWASQGRARFLITQAGAR
jgi:hypothetical protein